MLRLHVVSAPFSQIHLNSKAFVQTWIGDHTKHQTGANPMTTQEQLIEKVSDYLFRRDPSIIGISISITRSEVVERTETVERCRPTEAPPAPVLAPSEPEPQTDEPEPQGSTRGTRKLEKPDPEKHTNGRRYSDQEISHAKFLLQRGMRMREVARATGISYSQISNIKQDRSRRAVKAAPDPRKSGV
jgi:hypothetical protein